VKILLPPSEGKTMPTKSKALSLAALSFHKDLANARAKIINDHKEIDFKHCDLASNIYSGVLYQALNYSSLSAKAQVRADDTILIFSAAFGLLRLSDPIPYYKVKIDPSIWRKPLADALFEYSDELIVDCRSSTYSTVWTPNPQNTVGVRVFKNVDGARKVITHMSKQTRGHVARFLVSESSPPGTPQQLIQVMQKEFNCSLVAPAGKKSWFLDVIL
jgi:cytoplasmic iron level regulating protein YaaA (DUF328/UPF0246 family)